MAEHQRRIVGFAPTGEVMVAHGVHVVELDRLYVVRDQRCRGIGTALVRGLVDGFRGMRPQLRAWAPSESELERFFVAAGASQISPRWRRLGGGRALKGAIYGRSPALRRQAG